MSVFKIDINSTIEEIEDFYYLYVESFNNLCINKGKTIIDLGEYLKPSKSIKVFIEDVYFVTKGLGYIIYYTHNDDVITSISIIEIEELSKCYAILKFLCGNQSTQNDKINGISQGKYMLDFIFNIYGNNIILIEPASPALIPYYISYKKPSFPYDKNWLKESNNFLVYGNLYTLKEVCFGKIFNSINWINKMVNTLQFKSINDLYNNTNDLISLKEKLITKLDFLVKTKLFNPVHYEKILDNIINIKFYDIQDILMYSQYFNKGISQQKHYDIHSYGGKLQTKKRTNHRIQKPKTSKINKGNKRNKRNKNTKNKNIKDKSKLSKYKTQLTVNNKLNIMKRKTHKRSIIGGGPIDDSFLSCYDNNLSKIQKAIVNFSGKHYIDKTIANEFIEQQISPIRRECAKDLIDNTIYITLQEVSDIIEQLIIKLYTEYDLNSQETIYIYSGKPTKSFYFISVLALFYIRKHNFKQPTHFISELNNELFDIIGNDPLIILDDVSYSGSQLSTMLNNIYFNRVIKNKKQVPNIFIMLIALNKFSKAKLTNVPIKKTKSGTVLETTKTPFNLLYLQDRLYQPLVMKLGIERYFYLNIFFSPYTQDTPYVSLYLDHKLADEASTYKNILLYGPIVPNNYDYNDYLINIDYLYEILPSKSLFESNEYTQLLNTFNIENNTNFKSFNTSIIEFLTNKLLKLDIFDKNTDTSNVIHFKPFINECNQNPVLLKNISDSNIINCDYRLFMTPSGCIANTDDCVLTEDILGYLNNVFSSNNKQFIELNNKINSYICPFSWYKNGEYQMVCM